MYIILCIYLYILLTCTYSILCVYLDGIEIILFVGFVVSVVSVRLSFHCITTI